MSDISFQALLDAATRLIAIESTVDNPAGLHAAYEYMRDMVLMSGKDITIEEFESNGKPSFLAYRGQSRPDNFRIILNAHLDVISGTAEQYAAIIRNGKLYGRGAYDMKAAAVVLAKLFCEYVDRVPYALGLQIVTDEETGGFDGTYHQLTQGVRADFAICGECGRRQGTYEIANESKGIIFADVVFKGKTSHGAYPWEGNNAAMHAARFAQALHDIYPNPETESHGTTVTVTGIASTTGVYNKVPEHATVTLDCRFTTSDPHFQSKQAFADFIAGVDPEARIAAIKVFTRPMHANPHDPLMQELKCAAERVEGHTFSYAQRHAGSDGRHYLPIGGQACEFGVAGDYQHGDGEYVTLEALRNYLETMHAFLQRTIVMEPARQALEALSV